MGLGLRGLLWPQITSNSPPFFRVAEYDFFLVAEWIHFTLFGIILPTIKLKVYTFWWLMNSATTSLYKSLKGSPKGPKDPIIRYSG